MVKMVKYCIDCRKTFDDVKYALCPYCGKELIEKEKNRPPLGKLRHQILVRDGYRCRECGKSNKEASLDVDHIYPWSKGGPTTEDNLWTLCRECNLDKKDDEWKDYEIEATENALSNLENQLREASEDLEVATTEEEIFALKAKIKDFKKNKIPEEKAKLKRLKQEEERINAERKSQQEENKRRKNLYNKLYVQLEDELLLEVCNHFSLTEKSDEDNIRLLVSEHDEQEIYIAISNIKKELKEEAIRKELYDKLDNTLSSDEINLFVNEFSFKGSKHELLTYLIYNYTEDEIISLKIKLVQNEEERLAKERLENLKKHLLSSFTPEIFSLFSAEFNLPLNDIEIVDYLISNYSEEQIESLKVKLIEEEKKKNEFRIKILSSLTQKDLYLFSKEFNLPMNNLKIVDYLISNYSEKQIESLKVKLLKKDLINELKLSLEIKQLIFLCKHFSLKQCTRDALINHLEECSLEDIGKTIELMKKNDGKSAMDLISENNKNKNKLSEVKKVLTDNLLNSLTTDELSLFREKFKLMNFSNLYIAQYLIENYSEKEIESMRMEFKMDLIKDLSKTQVIFLCKYYSIKPTTKDNLMKHTEKCSLTSIKNSIEFMKKYDDGRPTKKILNSLKDEKKRSWVDEYIFDLDD